MIQKGSFLEIGSLCNKGFLQSSGLYDACDQHQFICTFPLQVKNRQPQDTNLNSHQHDVLNFELLQLFFHLRYDHGKLCLGKYPLLE